jgi:hypothetical protein
MLHFLPLTHFFKTQSCKIRRFVEKKQNQRMKKKRVKYEGIIEIQAPQLQLVIIISRKL